MSSMKLIKNMKRKSLMAFMTLMDFSFCLYLAEPNGWLRYSDDILMNRPP